MRSLSTYLITKLVVSAGQFKKDLLQIHSTVTLPEKNRKEHNFLINLSVAYYYSTGIFRDWLYISLVEYTLK